MQLVSTGIGTGTGRQAGRQPASSSSRRALGAACRLRWPPLLLPNRPMLPQRHPSCRSNTRRYNARNHGCCGGRAPDPACISRCASKRAGGERLGRMT